MENASKALIIAGAILISILIISFGVIILGQGSDVINNANMSDAEITAFNGKFEAYEGTSVRGSNVKQLLRTALQHNLAEQDTGKKVTVELYPKTGGTAPASTLVKPTSTTVDVNAVSSGSNYAVQCDYDTAGSGLIKTIKIRPL